MTARRKNSPGLSKQEGAYVMTTSTDATDAGILRRIFDQLERCRKQRTPLLLPMIVAICCALGIAGACAAEFFSAGIGFHAAFPMKSDGTSLTPELMSLRWPICFCLLAGDVLLQAVPSYLGVIFNRLLGVIGITACVLLLFGVGTFMFSSTFLTFGSGDGQEFVGHLTGVALGIAAAAMFTLSFLASHTMMAKLFTVFPVIAKGYAERKAIGEGARLVKTLEAHHRHREAIGKTIAEMEQPDALRRKAANEAGVITGMLAAELHDMSESREMRGDAEIRPQDRVDVPDVPLDALERRYADLQRYTADYFFNLLKQKEA
jgi:hypothetical protein